MCRIVGVEIDARLCVEDEGRRQCVVVEPVGRIVQRGEQPLGRAAGRAGIERIVERDRDRVDAEREAGRQGGGVVIGRVAGDGVVAVRKIDDMQNGRGRRIALIGDDLVAGGVESEAAQRDDRSRRDRGGRRVRDRVFAGRNPPAASQPLSVKLTIVPASTSRRKTNENVSVLLL